MKRFKIVVLDDTPPGEQGFYDCSVSLQTNTLEQGFQDPHPLLFILDENLNKGEASASPGSLGKALKTQVDSFPGTVYLVSRSSHPSAISRAEEFLFNELGSFPYKIILENAANSVDSQPSETFPSVPEQALETLLGLEKNHFHHFRFPDPERIQLFVQMVSFLSRLGKRFLFRCDTPILRIFQEEIFRASGLSSSEVSQNPLAQFARAENRGLILYDTSVSKEGRQLEQLMQESDVAQIPAQKGEERWDQIQKAFKEGKTVLFLKEGPFSFFQFLRTNPPPEMGFLLFWGETWNETSLCQFLSLPGYKILGIAGNNSYVLQAFPGHSLSSLPLVVVKDLSESTCLHVFRRLSVKKRIRPSWDDYFLGIAAAAAERATCDRGRSGCVIVRDKTILVTGYVGSPTGLPHCDEVGHQLRKVIHEDGHVSQHCVRTVHAEQNAICQAAKYGISLNGGTLYCRMTPCWTCAMLIINCGIKRVVCEYRYHAGTESEELFRKAGIELEFKHSEVLSYSNQ